MRTAKFYLVIVIMFSTVDAYIGPGLGTGVIGVLIGILTAVFLAITAIVWYPLKRLFKIISKKNKLTKEDDSEKQI